MKSLTKWLALPLIAFSAALVYWNYQVQQKVAQLSRVATEYETAWQMTNGCMLSPPGWLPSAVAYRTGDHGVWVKTNDIASYQGAMEYVANRSSFELRWHIATDTYMVARGGTDTELRVSRFVD